MDEKIRMTYLTMAFMYPMLFFVLFIATGGIMGDTVPFTLDSFMSPYAGEFAVPSIVLVLVCMLDVALFHVKLLPTFLPNPQNHLVAIVLPETFAVFGFIIGFINSNPWSAIPFFLFAFAEYVYVYTTISRMAES